MYVQDKNKDNDGGNGNIKEDGSVVTVRHPQLSSFFKVFVNIAQKTNYNSMHFHYFFMHIHYFACNGSICIDKI